jgi:Tfp pilus assembly protein PilO
MRQEKFMTYHNDEAGWKIVMDTISKFLIPFLILGVTWQYNQVSRLEERVYQLQATAVTEQKLQTTKQEIISFVDIRISDVNTKLDLLLKQMELQQRYNNNNNNGR